MKWFKLFWIATLLLGIDFATKAFVHANIPYLTLTSPYFPYGGIAVFQGVLGGIDFSINHVVNRGAAWGIFSRYQHLLIYFRIAILIFLVTYIFFINREKARRFPLVLVIVGAMGNVIDYFYYGYVIDFFYFKFWGYSYPLFNVADSVIFCGIILLILSPRLCNFFETVFRESASHSEFNFSERVKLTLPSKLNPARKEPPRNPAVKKVAKSSQSQEKKGTCAVKKL